MPELNAPQPAPRVTGYISDDFDAEDRYYRPSSSTVPPKSVDLRQKASNLLSPIYSQGEFKSCVANATATALWFEEKKAGRGDTIWTPEGPSRLFIYCVARYDGKFDSEITDGGTFPRAAMKAINQLGACQEKDCKYPTPDAVRTEIKASKPKLKDDAVEKAVSVRMNKLINGKPSSKAFDWANTHRITNYYRLDPDRPRTEDDKLSLEDKEKLGSKLLGYLKCCLAEGFPVVFGFRFYYCDDDLFEAVRSAKSGPAEEYVLKNPWKTVSAFPRHKPVPDDGHAVLAIGYNNDRQQVLVQNSWGKDWSKDGVFWMPYDFIKDFEATNDFWTIRIVAQPSAVSKRAASEPILWQEINKEFLGDEWAAGAEAAKA